MPASAITSTKRMAPSLTQYKPFHGRTKTVGVSESEPAHIMPSLEQAWGGIGGEIEGLSLIVDWGDSPPPRTRTGRLFALLTKLKIESDLWGDERNEAIAIEAERYLALNTTPGNWILDNNRDPAVKGGYSFGAKNPAGMCVDCSGLISGSFIAAGYDDPNHGNKDSGILNIESNLIKVKFPLRGDVVTFRNPKPSYPYHGGIVTNVRVLITNWDRDMPIYGIKVTFIHSSSGNGKIGVGGPMRTSFIIGGNSYFARNLHGFYRQ